MWPEPSKSKIGVGVVLAIVLYAAYVAVAIGIWKSSLWALLVFELSIFGIYLFLIGVGLVWKKYLEPVWREYGLRNPLNDRTSLWFIVVILFASAVCLLASVLYGKVYLIMLSSIIGAIAFYALINRQD